MSLRRETERKVGGIFLGNGEEDILKDGFSFGGNRKSLGVILDLGFL